MRRPPKRIRNLPSSPPSVTMRHWISIVEIRKPSPSARSHPMATMWNSRSSRNRAMEPYRKSSAIPKDRLRCFTPIKTTKIRKRTLSNSKSRQDQENAGQRRRPASKSQNLPPASTSPQKLSILVLSLLASLQRCQ